jgi:hypothetical protein
MGPRRRSNRGRSARPKARGRVRAARPDRGDQRHPRLGPLVVRPWRAMLNRRTGRQRAGPGPVCSALMIAYPGRQVFLRSVHSTALPRCPGCPVPRDSVTADASPGPGIRPSSPSPSTARPGRDRGRGSRRRPGRTLDARSPVLCWRRVLPVVQIACLLVAQGPVESGRRVYLRRASLPVGSPLPTFRVPIPWPPAGFGKTPAEAFVVAHQGESSTGFDCGFHVRPPLAMAPAPGSPRNYRGIPAAPHSDFGIQTTDKIGRKVL